MDLGLVTIDGCAFLSYLYNQILRKNPSLQRNERQVLEKTFGMMKAYLLKAPQNAQEFYLSDTNAFGLDEYPRLVGLLGGESVLALNGASPMAQSVSEDGGSGNRHMLVGLDVTGTNTASTKSGELSYQMQGS